MQRIGCLDIALDTGFACDSADAEEIAERVRARKGVVLPGEAEAAVSHGVKKLIRPVGDEDQHTYKQFWEWVGAWIDLNRLDVVSAEAPLSKHSKSSVQTQELLFGLYTASKIACAIRGVRFFKAHRQTVMVQTLGKGFGFAKKAEVIAWCKTLGWYPKDDNAADALAQYHYMALCHKRPPIVPPGSLFREHVLL